jgi:mannitol/fructose-specific phosphotransferase system IIA component (Ntr-type)
MITLTEALAREGVALDVRATSPQEALRDVAALLRNDPRVVNWDEVYSALCKTVRCVADTDAGFGICIPHARTDAATAMVMSAGRFDRDVLFPDNPQPIRYMFCIAVPVALASDYLRIVGLLARLLRDPENEGRLLRAPTVAEFVATLAQLEAQL